MADAKYTRLHITPFSPALLNTILPASVLPNARNISYHNIQTFPEKGYGYVELPAMDAEKIKKKLNGSILKGTKVRIEKARPEKEVVIEPQEPEPPKREKKKRKRDELPGVDIGERQVKRGWTTPVKDIAKRKDKKPVNKSKYTTGPECLFKTNLPPNVASKTKVTEVKVDKKKKKAGKETVVHEFTKTTKYATFLRSSGTSKTKHAAEYVEGKGWVDEEGNLVEEVITKKRKHKASIPEPPKEAMRSSDSEESEEENASGADHMNVESTLPDTIAKERSESSESEDSEDESASEKEVDDMDVEPALLKKIAEAESESSDSESSGSEDESALEKKADHIASVPLNADEGSSAEDSSDSSSEDETEDEQSKQPAEASSDSSNSSSSDSDSSDSSEDESEAEIPQSAASNRSQSSVGRGLSIKIPESSNSTPINTSVHPLEALYKRPKAEASASKEAAPSFSFFGADGDEEVEEESQHQVPLTPFTQKDFEYRGLRSAAPTPDTAHPNKRFVWPTDDNDDEEPEVSSPIRRKEPSEAAKEGKEGETESEFQKWFWENRGNVDRSWKARRRAVAKEKRQRENRRRQDRAL